jgi:hypothetical protein
MILSLPWEKQQKVQDLCLELLNTSNPTIKHSARAVGMITSAIPAFKEGKLHYRALEACKISSLKENHGKFNCRHLLSVEARNDLKWWTENLEEKTGVQIPQMNTHNFEVFSDASLTGFGVCSNNENYAGCWKTRDLVYANNHINGLELLAIKKGLERFAHQFEGKCILVRTDNATAVHYTNNMGGQSSHTCNEIARDI